MRLGWMNCAIAMLLLLTSCAATKLAPPSSLPQLPPLPAEISQPMEPNFLPRMLSFLSGKRPEPIPQSTGSQPANALPAPSSAP